jgi:hypothetical protein
MSQKARKINMWYRVRARDNDIFKPKGKVITFSIWSETDRNFWKLMKEKNMTEVKILNKTQEIILK